jgi:chaperonin GroES
MIPLFDSIIVKPEAISEVQKAGIIIPTTVQRKNLLGTVIAAGPEALSCHAGDVVVYDPVAGHKLILNDEEIVLMREGDIMVIFEKDIVNPLKLYLGDQGFKEGHPAYTTSGFFRAEKREEGRIYVVQNFPSK